METAKKWKEGETIKEEVLLSLVAVMGWRTSGDDDLSSCSKREVQDDEEEADDEDEIMDEEKQYTPETSRVMRSEGSTAEFTRFDAPTPLLAAVIAVLETLESLSECALRSKAKRASPNRSSTFAVCGLFLATPSSWWKALLARSSFGDE